MQTDDDANADEASPGGTAGDAGQADAGDAGQADAATATARPPDSDRLRELADVDPARRIDVLLDPGTDAELRGRIWDQLSEDERSVAVERYNATREADEAKAQRPAGWAQVEDDATIEPVVEPRPGEEPAPPGLLAPAPPDPVAPDPVPLLLPAPDRPPAPASAAAPAGPTPPARSAAPAPPSEPARPPEPARPEPARPEPARPEPEPAAQAQPAGHSDAALARPAQDPVPSAVSPSPASGVVPCPPETDPAPSAPQAGSAARPPAPAAPVVRPRVTPTAGGLSDATTVTPVVRESRFPAGWQGTPAPDAPAQHPTPLAVLQFATGERVEVVAPRLVLGRNPSPGEAGTQVLRLPDPMGAISRNHALLELVDGRWFITDLRSTNGTRAVMGDHDERLPSGQRIEVRGAFRIGGYEAALVE